MKESETTRGETTKERESRRSGGERENGRNCQDKPLSQKKKKKKKKTNNISPSEWYRGHREKTNNISPSEWYSGHRETNTA